MRIKVWLNRWLGQIRDVAVIVFVVAWLVEHL